MSYFYKNNNKWEGPFEKKILFKLNIEDNSLIWNSNWCPNKENVNNCIHTDRAITIKQLKQKEFKKQSIYILLSLFVIFIIFLFWIFSRSSQGIKSDETTFEFEKDEKSGKTKVVIKRKTEYYELKKIPNSEFIENKKGEYFIVDLKISEIPDKEIILFKPGEYIIDDLNVKFIDALNKFMDKLPKKLEDNNIENQIFIIGSADIKGNEDFRANLDKVYGIKKIKEFIEYYPKLENSESKFKSELKRQPVHSIYSNKDLPNLRARFIQYKIEQSYPNLKPIILEGSVKPQINSNLRNATLILFINPNLN